MREEGHRREIERTFREALRRDRARTKILRMSSFGVIEMTRQRIRPSLHRSAYDDCPHCGGTGQVKSPESVSIEVMRLLMLAVHRDDVRRIDLKVHPTVAAYLNNRKRRELVAVEVKGNVTIQVRSDPHVPAEHVSVDAFNADDHPVQFQSPREDA